MNTPTVAERDALFAELEAMPDFLADRFGRLALEVARRAGPDGTFSPVEHCWHLADLETEGFRVRIRRLLTEEKPFLPDFAGARLAQERQYKSKSLVEGLRVFREARHANVASLRAVLDADWSRRGVQEGVGELALADVPRLMRDHDATHRAEILAWSRASS